MILKKLATVSVTLYEFLVIYHKEPYNKALEKVELYVISKNY